MRLAYLTLACLASGCVFGCGVEGWHTANPKTIVRFDPMSRSLEFYDSKDNDLTIEKLIFSPDTKTVDLTNLKIINNASNVRRANVDQIDALAREATAIGLAWQQGIQAAAQLIAAGVPIATGGQVGLVPQGWSYATPATKPTTSRPSQ